MWCMKCGGAECGWPECGGPGDGAVDTGTGANRGLRGAPIKGGAPGGEQNCGVLTSGAEGTA